MKPKKLVLYRCADGSMRAWVKTRHSRLMFIKVKEQYITDCYYIDRAKRCVPKKLVTRELSGTNLEAVLENELDCRVYGTEVSGAYASLTDEEFISHIKSDMNRKHNFLIMIKTGEILETVIKNRNHRVIYIRITIKGDEGVIEDCYYCDRMYKKREKVVPENLHSVYFYYSKGIVLNIINYELNNAFTDVILIEDTSINIDKRPLCGSI